MIDRSEPRRESSRGGVPRDLSRNCDLAALAELSNSSKYCKLIQADDWLFPDCLQLMVRIFEQSETIGLVSSYWLEGDTLCGSGYPINIPIFRGRDCAKWFLRTETRVFGSQSTVMYRSSVVRERKEFYNVKFLAADLEVCLEILKEWDFGFIPQVLSFTRRDNGGINYSLGKYLPYQLHGYIILQRYSLVFMDASEATAIKRKAKRYYYGVLARAALQLRGCGFWRFHAAELKMIPETINRPYLLLQIAIVSTWIVSNPGKSIVEAKNRLMQSGLWAALNTRTGQLWPLRRRALVHGQTVGPMARVDEARELSEGETRDLQPPV
jgi:glycosyltransferase involved in cell wall biosynthesis